MSESKIAESDAVLETTDQAAEADVNLTALTCHRHPWLLRTDPHIGTLSIFSFPGPDIAGASLFRRSPLHQRPVIQPWFSSSIFSRDWAFIPLLCSSLWCL